MKKMLFILCISFTVLSCEKEATINLTKMDGFPEDLMGCTCYFAENEADFKEQKFIYVDSYERNPAYISVDDSLVSVSAEDDLVTDYEAILTIDEEVQLGSELYHKQGTLTIVHKSGAVVTKDIYGECGC